MSLLHILQTRQPPAHRQLKLLILGSNTLQDGNINISQELDHTNGSDINTLKLLSLLFIHLFMKAILIKTLSLETLQHFQASPVHYMFMKLLHKLQLVTKSQLKVEPLLKEITSLQAIMDSQFNLGLNILLL